MSSQRSLLVQQSTTSWPRRTSGDQAPYRPEPPFAGQLERNETLRLFQFTPAQQALDMAADMFPLYQYNPVMEDSGPLMEPPEGPSAPEMQLKSVVFPDPLGPIRPTNSPSRTSKETP